MTSPLITILRTLNQLLTAGISITAFSLLLYALSFNLHDRVTRSFALILTCVMVVFVGDAISSVSDTNLAREFWLRFEWIGVTLLPAAYVHFSDAILTTTGRPSRGRRRFVVRLGYVLSVLFLATLPFELLVGPLVPGGKPAPHLQRTSLTLVFTAYYLVMICFALVNMVRAYRRTVTRASRRRMGYLFLGSLAPALGSYPYLLFGSGFALRHTGIFWLAAVLSNIAVSFLLILMAYAVAFFGVPWPDRVVKRRLAKWLMRGPVTGSTVLAVTTVVRRVGERFGLPYNAAVPILMVATMLLMEHFITLVAPLWERWLLHGNDREDLEVLQKLEDRLLTAGDLRQFLEAILAAVCDRIQSKQGFIATLAPTGLETLVTIGNLDWIEKEDLSQKILEQVTQSKEKRLFSWGDFWLVPLFTQRNAGEELLGLMCILRHPNQTIDDEQNEALNILAQRASLALEDRMIQSQVFNSLAELTPDMELIQNLRAVSRYNGGSALMKAEVPQMSSAPSESFARWVKDALTHYWGGPKLSQNPLTHLRIVQQTLQEHDGNPTNALRAVLRKAMDQIKPEGERRFTGEWILYNILELKFMEGKSVREVAKRLALSEADLYRKQRVAIEEVARTIIDMENQASETSLMESPNLIYEKRGGLNGDQSSIHTSAK
ncbi:MAG: histidine kinase N-terminal 7TM domain-containing protein [Anaerolineales bacterium]